MQPSLYLTQYSSPPGSQARANLSPGGWTNRCGPLWGSNLISFCFISHRQPFFDFRCPSIHHPPSTIHHHPPSIRQNKLALAWDPGGGLSGRLIEKLYLITVCELGRCHPTRASHVLFLHKVLLTRCFYRTIFTHIIIISIVKYEEISISLFTHILGQHTGRNLFLIKNTVRARLGTARARLGTARARLVTARARLGTVRARLGTVRARLG